MVSIEQLRARFGPDNPAAPLNRRDRLARALARLGLPCSRHDDKDTHELRQFYGRPRTRGSAGRGAVSKDYRALATAIKIERGELECLKPILKALFLTELDDAAIATELQLSEETVRWYRVAFFELDRCRNTPLLILHRVIGIVDEAGKMTLNIHKLWMLVAYFWKSAALKKLLLMSPPNLDSNTEWPEWLSSLNLAMIKFKQTIAVNGLKADDPKQNAMLWKLIGQEVGASGGEEKDEFSASLRQVKSLLDDIPWTVGSDAEKTMGGTQLYKFDKGAAELRDNEVSRVAGGEAIEGADEIQSLRMPPPTRQKPNLGELHQRPRTNPPVVDTAVRASAPTKQVMPPGTVKPPPSNRQK